MKIFFQMEICAFTNKPLLYHTYSSGLFLFYPIFVAS